MLRVTDWLTGWLTEADWLIDWLIHWSIDFFDWPHLITPGGFECYIISDTAAEGDATLAAEVYTADGEDAEESLLSVSPGNNVLSLVMRDQGIMRWA